jgi:hypothetical protein
MKLIELHFNLFLDSILAKIFVKKKNYYTSFNVITTALFSKRRVRGFSLLSNSAVLTSCMRRTQTLYLLYLSFFINVIFGDKLSGKEARSRKKNYSFLLRRTFCRGNARHLKEGFISLKEFMQESSRTFYYFSKV